ncbi:MAG: ATP-binding protein [Defluviitaleaceae bacterium]|nr:ATP-binding protein [Defluviitaleaceae bacterium]
MNFGFETLRTIAILIHVLSLLTVAVMGYFVITRLKSIKREYFILIAFFTYISLLGIIFEMMANTVDGGLLGWRLVYLGGMMLAPLFLMFVQHYCEIHLPKIINILAFATALGIIALTWTTHLHNLIHESAQLYPGGSPGPGLTVWGATNGILWPVVVIHPSVCMILVFYILYKKSKTASKTQRKRLWVLVAFAAPPGISQVLTFFDLSIIGMHWNGILAPIALVVLYFGLSRYDLMENEETIRAQSWLRDMIANISHDIKTPLTVLSANIEKLLETSPNDPEYPRDIQIAYNKNLDLQRLIQNLIEVTRIEAAQNLYKPEWVPLSSVLVGVQKKHGDYLESMGLYLDISGNAGEEEPHIYTDPIKLWSVFDNIIYNAARHTEHGGISITAKTAKDSTTIAITDTGCGIAEKHLPHIFDQFYKTEADRGSKAGESGLGLYIVKSIMEGCGGTVGMQSQENIGTTILLTFKAMPQNV